MEFTQALVISSTADHFTYGLTNVKEVFKNYNHP